MAGSPDRPEIQGQIQGALIDGITIPRFSDETTSHLTNQAKDAWQVIGYAGGFNFKRAEGSLH